MNDKPKPGAGHLKNAFLDFLDSDANDSMVDLTGERRSIHWVCDQLSECTDTLPAEYCEELNLTEGSSYGKAAEIVRQFLAE